jgi:hypothetical protein
VQASGEDLMKTIYGGEWVRVRNMMNKHFDTSRRK